MRGKGGSVIALEGVHFSYRVNSRPVSALRNLASRKFASPTLHISQVDAVRNVTLTIRQGESVGIIGRNGSGKSTILKLMSGALKPTSGVVQVSGEVGTLLSIGSGFKKELTGRENALLIGLARGFSKRKMELKMEEIADFADLGRFFDLPVRTYSTGMKARLGFALAATDEPNILLIDEALATGDRTFRNRAQARMRSIQESAGTIVMVSHSLGTIRQQCSRVLWISQGAVVRDGDAASVIEAYTTESQEC